MDELLARIHDLDVWFFLWLNALSGSEPADAAMRLLSLAGLGHVAPVIAGVYLWFSDKRIFWRRIVAASLIALALGGLGQIAKHSLNWPRPVRALSAILDRENEVTTPYLGLSTRTQIPFRPGMAPADYPRDHVHVQGPVYSKRSMPSGHTIAAFAFATALFFFTRRRAWLVYLAAALVGLSRVYNGVHFLSDVIAGAAMATAGTWLVLVLLEHFTPLLFYLPARKPRGDRPPSILVVAGEASADMYAANLAKEITAKRPGTRVLGVGGPAFAGASAQVLHDAAELSLMGFTEIAPALGRIRRIFLSLSKRLLAGEVDALVCIDLPDFNLMLARRANDLGVPVCYYVTPQVWAWRTGRAKTIAKRTSRVIPAFPFEADLFERAGADVRYGGHPLVEIARPRMTRDEAFAHFGLDSARPVIAVLPGSRSNEWRYMIEPLFGAVEILAERHPEYQFAIPVAPTRDPAELEQRIARSGRPIVLTRGDNYDLYNIASFGLITSGTATLEAALFALPMVIGYRGGALNIAIAKKLAKVVYAGLPNLIAGRAIVPELIQEDCTAERLAETALRIFDDATELERMKTDLERVRDSLAGDGASESAAGWVLELIDG